jgi:hypothetical protein
MYRLIRFRNIRNHRLTLLFVLTALLLSATHFYLYGQDKSGFPDGYDAVQAAPGSHKVIFENALVRVLEVTVPPPGATIPMHHHRWPGFFLSWDRGGRTPHVLYHRPDGTVRDVPSRELPAHPGSWTVQWMEPEPMHAIEVVESAKSAGPTSNDVSDLRIEIKCRR